MSLFKVNGNTFVTSVGIANMDANILSQQCLRKWNKERNWQALLVLNCSNRIKKSAKMFLDSLLSSVQLLLESGTSVVVPYCYLFLMSVFIHWFTYYVSDIFR